ncbi:MAG TPA: hypothetical protein VIL74_05840 [Pyrinomonadaceae bacterium]|jgi:hypothetical protein
MRKLLRYAAGITLIFPAALFIYWLALVFPQPFFRLERVENLYLYHHADADKVRAVGERALAKIKRSGFYNPSAVYRVFLTDSSVEYAFYTSRWRNSGGVFLIFANGNIFIRPSLIGDDRLIGPGGQLVAEDRPLHYFIAHEAAHAMQYEKLGFSKYTALDEWVREGVADRVGRDAANYGELLAKYRAGDASMDRNKSGLYLKYLLLVEYALREKGLTPESLLERNPSEAGIEEELKNSGK